MGRKERDPQMTAEQFRNEKLYETAMSLVRSMRDRGLVTGEEYAEIDTKMLAKYRPVFGTLYAKPGLIKGA